MVGVRSWSAGLNHANNPQRGYFLPSVVNSFLYSSGLRAYKSMCFLCGGDAQLLEKQKKNLRPPERRNCRSLCCNFNNNGGAVITATLKALSLPAPSLPSLSPRRRAGTAGGPADFTGRGCRHVPRLPNKREGSQRSLD